MATSGETVTYAEYEAGSNRVAHLLRAAGLRRGDHISIFIENQPRLLEIQGGAERTGLYYTLINTYLGADEVAYIVANSRSRMLFSSAAKRQVAESAAAMSPQLERKLMTGPAAPPAGWESSEAAVAGRPDQPVADASLGAAMLYSSGITGQPKGILRDLPEIAPSEPLPVLDFVRHMFGFREGMTYLNPAPLYHSAPQASVSGALRLGATAVVMEHFDAEQWLALVERYRVTHCQMVPVMFSRLLRLPEEVRGRYDTSSLECVVHAAAPCPVHVKQAMIDWLGPIITEYYGATEANGFTFCDSAQWLAHPGTVGDIGHVDEEGYLYLTDRKTYMIISGGVNIYPQETENLLSGHPAVVDVAVIGVPNEDLGEEVKAVVQPADLASAGPDLARELIEYCRARLAHFKCPKTVDFVPDLPRSATGK